MQLGYFPKIWKTALVLVFPKSGKPQSLSANYRPISLLRAVKYMKRYLIYK